MWYVLLSILLVATIASICFLGWAYFRLKNVQDVLVIDYDILLTKKRRADLALAVETALSYEIKRELEDAFKNLEMVLDSENSPGSNSDEKFHYPDWSNPPGMIRQPVGITEADQRESVTPIPQISAGPENLKRGYW